MMDQTIPARMAASLAAALSSRPATIEAHNETTTEADNSGTGKSYGLVLKGRNEFAAAAGVTGAAAARIDNPGNEASLALSGTCCRGAGLLVSAVLVKMEGADVNRIA